MEHVTLKSIVQLVKKARRTFRQEGAIVLFKKFQKFFERQVYMLSKRRQKVLCQTIQQEEWPIEKPLVSVIIPCYNYGIYIEAAIESVLSQTFQRFEILVINDGSTDGFTKNVLHHLCYRNTKVFHQANQGLAQTMNNGAVMAAGKYICYLDADDSIEPTYLEKTLFLLESDESLGACYSWVQCFGERDSIWETQDMDPFFLRQYTTASSHTVIRKEAWDKVKKQNGAGFLSKYDGYFEDWVFWIDMVQCGYRGQVIKEPLIRYRVHKNSLGSVNKPNWEKMLEVLHEDRREFFHNRSYQRKLEKSLNKKIQIENNRINITRASS